MTNATDLMSTPTKNECRGPYRKVLNIQETPSATLIKMECGHTGSFAQHFYHKLSEPQRCFKCWAEAFPVEAGGRQ